MGKLAVFWKLGRQKSSGSYPELFWEGRDGMREGELDFTGERKGTLGRINFYICR